MQQVPVEGVHHGRNTGDAGRHPAEHTGLRRVRVHDVRPERAHLRHERAQRSGHQMLAHLRTDAYPVYASPRYPPFRSTELSYERNLELIDVAKGITKTIYSEDTAATEKITSRK